MKITPEMLMDKRLQQRHLRSGLIDKATLDRQLAALPDVSAKAVSIRAELASVGVSTVRAKDTGESE